MKKALFIFCIVIIFINTKKATAQNTFPNTGAAGIGTTMPNASSLLEIKSTTQGLLMPRMKKQERDLISAPATGLIIYQTDMNPGFYFYNGGTWKAIAVTSSNPWTISGNNIYNNNTGNVGIGTTTPGGKLDVRGDAFINGIRVGRGSGNSINNTVLGSTALVQCTSGDYNTATGAYAMYSSTTGSFNTANGYRSLYSNIAGGFNTACGYEALYYNLNGNNCAFGHQALYNNTYGSDNIATGVAALYSNMTGSNNIASGSFALFSNTGGNYNIANGASALNSNTTGSFNIASGNNALYTNTEGGENVAIGDISLYSNLTGDYNLGIGYSALYYNTTGRENIAIGGSAMVSNTTGNGNTVVGNGALFYNQTGRSNVAIGINSLRNSTNSNLVAVGDSALYSNTSGYQNVAIGSKALSNNFSGANNMASGWKALYNTTGSGNTGVGNLALYANTSGSNNTCVGNNAYPTTATINNYTGIGYNVGTNGSASNMVELGNSFVTVIRGQVNFSTYSDERIKKNIRNNVPGLAFINLLKPATYNIDLDKENAIIYKNKKSNNDTVNKYDIAKQLKTGFLAQEVEAAAKKLNYDFSGVVKPQNENDLYSLRYSEFVVPLVKAVQELSTQNDSLKKQNEQLSARLDKIEAMLSSNQSSSSTSSQLSKQTVELGSIATLSQNVPNPFKNSTIINYYLPVNNGGAFINFYGENGLLLKTVKLSGNGKGYISIKTNELAAGTYRYALMIDGKIVDSKQMILTK